MYTATYKHLNTAEEARCVFLKVGNKHKTLMLIADGSTVPVLDGFFWRSSGRSVLIRLLRLLKSIGQRRRLRLLWQLMHHHLRRWRLSEQGLFASAF
jgi:hypothetical protein